MLKIRDLQDETGGFTAFIPWTFQPGGTNLGGETLGAVEYLRTLAISRLVLDNVPHMQVSWVTQGGKVAQLALKFGADDFGSTMLEENVVAATGVGFRLPREEIETLIRQAGYEPRVRDHRYKLEGRKVVGGGQGFHPYPPPHPLPTRVGVGKSGPRPEFPANIKTLRDWGGGLRESFVTVRAIGPSPFPRTMQARNCRYCPGRGA